MNDAHSKCSPVHLQMERGGGGRGIRGRTDPSALEAELRALQAKFSALEEESKRWKGDTLNRVAELVKDSDNLKELLSEYRTFQEAYRDSEERNEKSLDTLALFRLRLGASNNKRDQLAAQLADAEARHAKEMTAKVRNEKRALANELNEKHAVEMARERERHAAELAREGERIAELTRKRDQARNEKANLNLRVSELQKGNKVLKGETTKLKEEKTQLDDEIASLGKRLEDALKLDNVQQYYDLNIKYKDAVEENTKKWAKAEELHKKELEASKNLSAALSARVTEERNKRLVAERESASLLTGIGEMDYILRKTIDELNIGNRIRETAKKLNRGNPVTEPIPTRFMLAAMLEMSKELILEVQRYEQREGMTGDDLLDNYVRENRTLRAQLGDAVLRIRELEQILLMAAASMKKQ